MDLNISSNSEPEIVACPECGGDVSVLRHTSQHWAHRSRILASVVWLFFVLGVCLYLVSIGTWYHYTDSVELRRHIGSERRLALVPWAPLTKPSSGYLSLDEMERVVDGDADAMVLVRDTLQASVDYAEKKRGVSGLLGIRYGLVGSDAHINNKEVYRFGGDWITLELRENLKDIRDAGSIDSDQYIDWEVIDWTILPTFSYTKRNSDTTNASNRSHSLSVHYLTILGVLSVCMILAWLIRWVGFLVGIGISKKKWAWSAVVIVLFFGCTAGAVLNPEANSYRSSTAPFSTPLLPIVSIEELRGIAKNPESAARWCTEVLALNTEEQHGGLLLGQLWVFDESADESTHQGESEYLLAMIGYEFPLVSSVRMIYVPDGTGEENSKPQWFQVRVLHELGALGHWWGPLRAPSFILIHIVHIALIGVSFYWIWIIFQWAGRLVLGRVQGRRVLKKRCIFCCYPLTERGIIARSSINST